MSVRLFASLAAVASVFALPATQSTSTTTVSSTTVDSEPASTSEATLVAAPPKPLGGPQAHSFFSPAWLPHGQNLNPRLSQSQTNGKSWLGTSRAPKLPHWLSGSGEPMPNGRPWGTRTAGNTDPYTNPPNTGVTRHYDFTISKQDIWPDGMLKHALVINGAFPGPTIEANWGDWIEVTVHNNLEDEGTSLHWHGLLQTATPWADGVPSVQMCPIAPGSSFVYRFKADLYGTSWYHSHFSAQYAGGLEGAMIIYGPSENAAYDEDLGPIFLTDYYHDDYYTLVEQVMAPASEFLLPPLSNNNLINGKMNYPCGTLNSTQCKPNAGVSKFKFQCGKKYRLRLINGGAEGIQKFSIDNHKMTVIAQDFVPLVPYEVDVVTLGVGQRTDIIVEANGKSTDAVWMRSTLGPSAFVGGCSLSDGISPEAVAAIYYQNANTTAVPNTTTSVPAAELVNCANDALTASVPYYKISPPKHPATTEVINIEYLSNGTNNLFYVNNSTFHADYNDPLLLEAKLGHTKFPSEWNVHNYGSSSSIRMVIYNKAVISAHPMHMHGHNFYVLAEGTGTWDGTITNSWNPTRRDTHLLQNAVSDTEPSYLVVQIDADNPGAWPFHCHIAWHVSGGLYMNILERPNDIKKLAIPSTYAQTCRNWAAWTGKNVVDEIDSGL